ncbi:MAG: hypothetical protein CMJ81_04230 [Planctomycetaceae bacterium]|nr:hypothetical protein [Planctomycetaceae bacterium]MBP62871.1 hypothetical protein [Planctomycetaceae bacterium]
MPTEIHHLVDLSLQRHRVSRRRDFLRAVSASAIAAGSLSWRERMTAEAARLRQQGRACILLWMRGGPSQFETFSPQPDHPHGGETRAISTSVPGIQIAEYLPETARSMQEICLIRSMTSKEGSHQRASYLLHTGYVPTAGVRNPTLGSLVSERIGDVDNDLPNFVRIGGRGRGNTGGGFLGIEYDPLVLNDPQQQPDNTTLLTGKSQYQKRLRLLKRLEDQHHQESIKQLVSDHQGLYERASRLVLSPEMKAFDISQEPEQVHKAYGDSKFSSACLLARRLIESGVTFVEVDHGNWDTHDDNFERSRELCNEMDRAYSVLLHDLKQRGLLDRTLVIWMGEFGRSPRINARAGRDHFTKAFNVALAGAGVRGGQVIGETETGGEEVSDHPVSVPDLFRTFCHALKIDPEHERMSPIGRPIKIVEQGQVVPEIFG